MKVPEPKKLPSGTWFIQMRLNGVSVPVSAPSKKECIQQAQLIKAEYLAGRRRIASNDITLREAITEYIDAKKGLSPTTLQGYEKSRDQYFQRIMDKPLRDIDIDAINDAIYAEQARVSRRGQPLSPKTIREAWHLISTVLKRNHIRLDDEPDLPELKKKPVQILSFEEVFDI